MKINKILFFFILFAFSYSELLYASTCNCHNWKKELIKNNISSVVSITSTHASEINEDPLNDIFKFFDRFHGFNGKEFQYSPHHLPRSLNRKSLGSGVIYDKDGTIITNYHVIKNSKEIEVGLETGETLKATVIGIDPKTDLALLKVHHGNSLTYANFGNSDKMEVGDEVVAIGNPLGFKSTATYGIISGIQREFSDYSETLIQTDAAINQGNSGGPLFNRDGHVIGINTAIATTSGGNVGLGFAIPSNIAKDVVDKLKSNGSIKRGYLGVTIKDVEKEIFESLGRDDLAEGALVVDIVSKSPASKSQMKIGDIIIKFNNDNVKNAKSLARSVMNSEVGKNAKITLLRDSKILDISIKIEQIENESINYATTQSSEEEAVLGMTLSYEKVSDNMRSTYNLKNDISQVIVIKSISSELQGKVLAGDIIVSVNQKEIKNINQAKEIIRNTKARNVLFMINRKGANIFVTLNK